jgi:hypothetical protein
MSNGDELRRSPNQPDGTRREQGTEREGALIVSQLRYMLR